MINNIMYPKSAGYHLPHIIINSTGRASDINIHYNSAAFVGPNTFTLVLMEQSWYVITRGWLIDTLN